MSFIAYSNVINRYRLTPEEMIANIGFLLSDLNLAADTKIFTLYSANNGQVEPIEDCAHRNGAGKLTYYIEKDKKDNEDKIVFHGSGQAKVHIDFIGAVNKLDQSKIEEYSQRVAIFPIPTSQEGSHDVPGNQVSLDDLVKRLRKLENHLTEGHIVLYMVMPSKVKDRQGKPLPLTDEWQNLTGLDASFAFGGGFSLNFSRAEVWLKGESLTFLEELTGIKPIQPFVTTRHKFLQAALAILKIKYDSAITPGEKNNKIAGIVNLLTTSKPYINGAGNPELCPEICSYDVNAKKPERTAPCLLVAHLRAYYAGLSDKYKKDIRGQAAQYLIGYITAILEGTVLPKEPVALQGKWKEALKTSKFSKRNPKLGDIILFALKYTEEDAEKERDHLGVGQDFYRELLIQIPYIQKCFPDKFGSYYKPANATLENKGKKSSDPIPGNSAFNVEPVEEKKQEESEDSSEQNQSEESKRFVEFKTETFDPSYYPNPTNTVLIITGPDRWLPADKKSQPSRLLNHRVDLFANKKLVSGSSPVAVGIRAQKEGYHVFYLPVTQEDKTGNSQTATVLSPEQIQHNLALLKIYLMFADEIQAVLLPTLSLNGSEHFYVTGAMRPGGNEMADTVSQAINAVKQDSRTKEARVSEMLEHIETKLIALIPLINSSQHSNRMFGKAPKTTSSPPSTPLAFTLLKEQLLALAENLLLPKNAALLTDDRHKKIVNLAQLKFGSKVEYTEQTATYQRLQVMIAERVLTPKLEHLSL